MDKEEFVKNVKMIQRISLEQMLEAETEQEREEIARSATSAIEHCIKCLEN